MTLVYVWVMMKVTLRQAVPLTGCSMNTVCDWFNLCREVCTSALSLRSKLVGTADRPIQVDESYFSGRRKYHRGRILKWDRSQNLQGQLPNWHEEAAPVSQKETQPTSSRNYGNRVVGPWVVGLYESNEKVRFIVVPDRKGSTLLSVIQEHVASGSVIVTDEWRGYRGLQAAGFEHYTVNHSTNFVDPETGYHTQGIERMWVDSKSFMKHARHPGPLLQSHLDECAWRKMRSGYPGGYLAAFLHDVKENYSMDD